MGDFSRWVESLKSDIKDGVAGSVRFVHKVFHVSPSDAQVDKAAAKAQAAMDSVEALLVEVVDEIPGVPRIVAKQLAMLVGAGLQAAIASAAEGAKTANDGL